MTELIDHIEAHLETSARMLEEHKKYLKIGDRTADTIFLALADSHQTLAEEYKKILDRHTQDEFAR